MIKKIVLVKPPERSFFNYGTFSLAVIAASVRNTAKVILLDASQLQSQKAAHEIFSFEPDLIGITVMSLTSVGPAAKFVREMRQAGMSLGNKAAGVSVVAGGHGATLDPKTLLLAGAEAVIMGEGERSLRQIVQDGIVPGAPGIACLDRGQMIIGPSQSLIQPLDELNPPARDLMPLSSPYDIHLMETSRGCPHNCSFCEASQFYTRQWRPYSPRRVAEEVTRLVTEYDAWIIHFADDNFAASPDRVLCICEELKRVPRPAYFITAARGDDLLRNPDVLPSMASAGILRVTVGVETLNPSTALANQKSVSLELYKDVFKRMRTLGIFSLASFIVGLPGEKPDARKQAVELALEVQPDSVSFLPFWPFPGNPFETNHDNYRPKSEDISDAHKFSVAFHEHPRVKKNLTAAEEKGGIRGLHAEAVLAKYARGHHQPDSGA